MDASFYLDDNSQDFGDQIVPSARLKVYANIESWKRETLNNLQLNESVKMSLRFENQSYVAKWNQKSNNTFQRRKKTRRKSKNGPIT